MKNYYLTLIAFLTLSLAALSNQSFAQTAGPSDATSAPPTNATDVGKVLCAGTTISITGPQDVGGVDFTHYHWYKLDASGTAQLVASQTGRTYTETPTTAGYYTYELVTENASGCTSPMSDPFKIYVLPPLSATITSPTSTICASTGSTVLTANPTPATGYTLTYQWTRNGTNITGATSSTYTVTGETTAATVTFGVTVAYALNSSCTATATDSITVAPLPTKPTISAN